MAPDIEKLICELLIQADNPQEVARELLKKFRNEDLSLQEQESILNFVINSGYLKDALKVFHYLFRKKKDIPWAQFIELLHAAGEMPSRATLQALFKGAKRQNLLEQLVTSHKWDDFDPQFEKMRKKKWQRLGKEIAAQKQILKEKLTFLSANRMIDEEEKLLSQLKKMFPKDPDLLKHEKEFRDRWARAVLSNNVNNVFANELSLMKEVTLTKEEKKIAGVMYKSASSYCKKKPNAAYDLAIGFSMMELNQEAIQILNFYTNGPQKDWLMLELLLKTKNYLVCLELTDQIELKYIDDPESTFAATYIRAKAMNGLGQTSSAIELLQSIIKIRPSYRSANSLLHEWEQGVL